MEVEFYKKIESILVETIVHNFYVEPTNKAIRRKVLNIVEDRQRLDKLVKILQEI